MPFVRPWRLGQDVAQDRDNLLGEFAQQAVDSLGDIVLVPYAALVENRDNARFRLLAGTHGGFRLVRPGTTVAGPGRVVRQVVISGDGPYVLDGLTFQSFDPDGRLVSDTAQTPLVDIISTTATVFFQNCRFLKRTSDACLYVNIASGADVHFVNCSFEPASMPAGFVIDNAGAAANVGVTNCSNVTGQPNNNATVVFLTT